MDTNETNETAELAPIAEVAAMLIDLDVPAAGVRAALKKKGYSDEAIEEAVPSVKRVCFLNDYLAFLGDEKRSIKEATDFIMTGTTDNVQKYKTTHLNTAALALRIWEANES